MYVTRNGYEFFNACCKRKKTIWFYINVFLYSYIVYILYAYMDILLYNITYNTRKRVWVFWIKCLGYIIYKRDAFCKIILLPPLPEELLKGNQFFLLLLPPLTPHPFSPLVIASEFIHAYICINMYRWEWESGNHSVGAQQCRGRAG